MHNNYSIALLQKRLLVFILLITFLFFALIVRVGFIQIIDGANLQIKATGQWTRDVPLKAERGEIIDSTGAVLAKSVLTFDVYVRHKNVVDSNDVALFLSKELDLDFDEVYKKVIDQTVSEVVIKLQVDESKAKKIRDAKKQGIVLSENYKRQYPYGDLLTQVLGFTTVDNIGQFGIESYYDDLLKGINGTLLTQSDVKGNEIDNTIDYYLPSQKGCKIVTTINHNIQSLLEDALSLCIQEQKASKAMALVINPNTGEVLAMSCKPSFDLNNVPRNDVKSLLANSKNMLVTDVYEPGSTFKILTSAIALNEKVVTLDEQFYDPGYRIVDGEKIKCWKLIGHGSENFQDGFCNSCNSVFIDLALRLGVERFYEQLHNFGLEKVTGIDFQGEVAGIMMDKDIVKNVDLARMGFGQAVAVTPIQLTCALCATINGGELLTPYIVKEILDVNNNIITARDKEVKRRVISPEVSNTIRIFLEDAVGRPNGNYTFIPGYSVGGKTGTTQKYTNGKISGDYIASFFGTYPANNPNYAILFIVDEPKGTSYYGSIVATPYAKKVIEGIIALNGDLPVSSNVQIKQVTMPNLIGLSLTKANEELKRVNLNYELVGDGGIVFDQFPKEGVVINQNQIVQITVR